MTEKSIVRQSLTQRESINTCGTNIPICNEISKSESHRALEALKREHRISRKIKSYEMDTRSGTILYRENVSVSRTLQQYLYRLIPNQISKSHHPRAESS